MDAGATLVGIGWNLTSTRRAANAMPNPIRLLRTDTRKHPVNKSPARQPMMEEFTAHSKSNQFKPLFISCAVTNALLLRSTGLRSAPSPSRPRPFHFATARSSRADYMAQPRALPLGCWLRRCATSSVPVLPPSESLRFLRQHPNRSASSGERRRYQLD